MNSQSLSFTDKQIALLLNAIQLVIVASGMHPACQTGEDILQHVDVATEALASFSPSEYASTHRMLKDAAHNFDMSTNEMFLQHVTQTASTYDKQEAKYNGRAPLTDEMRRRFMSN